MSTNMNQYGFLELNNSRIMINKPELKILKGTNLPILEF